MLAFQGPEYMTTQNTYNKGYDGMFFRNGIDRKANCCVQVLSKEHYNAVPNKDDDER